nr:MAG TPA: hypothetical protein [Caudoviricetes sp.]
MNTVCSIKLKFTDFSPTTLPPTKNNYLKFSIFNLF